MTNRWIRLEAEMKRIERQGRRWIVELRDFDLKDTAILSIADDDFKSDGQQYFIRLGEKVGSIKFPAEMSSCQIKTKRHPEKPSL